MPLTLKFTPRKWQEDALITWSNEFKGIISVATGAGKTIFAEMCISAFWDQYPEGRVIVTVPTLALLDQWYVSLREDFGVAEDDIACYSGEDRPNTPRRINLMVINTARSFGPIVSNNIDSMLIVDECHRAASSENSLAMRGDHLATLGLSATPEREYDDLFQSVLVPALGPIVYRYGHREALEDGVNVPFGLINVKATMLPNERKAYNVATAQIARAYKAYKAGKISKESLTKKLQQRARNSSKMFNRIPVALRLAQENRGKKILIFHESIDAAKVIHRLLVAANFNATIYHSKIPPHVRRDNLRLYKRGIFDVLVTCRALDEGMDVPEANVAIIAASTASIRQRIQRLGRVLRPSLNKSKALVYTVYLTKPEETRLIREAGQIEEGDSVAWIRSQVRSDG